jgi:hypothetical protein
MTTSEYETYVLDYDDLAQISDIDRAKWGTVLTVNEYDVVRVHLFAEKDVCVTHERLGEITEAYFDRDEYDSPILVEV